MPKLPKKNYIYGGFDEKRKKAYFRKTHFGNICLTALCFGTLAWGIVLQIAAHNAQFFSECEKSVRVFNAH